MKLNRRFVDACEKWDATRRVKPSTYLVPRIRGAILDGRRKRSDGSRKHPMVFAQLDDLREPSQWSREPSQWSREPEHVALRDALSRLSDDYADVLHLYYYEDISLKRIGEMRGVTESRISQIKTTAVIELQRLFGVGVAA